MIISRKKRVFQVIFLYSVSFCTKNSTKNRLFWILPFFSIQGIIITLSAAPTPQHTHNGHIVLAEYQAYDINAQACPTVVLFLTHPGERRDFFLRILQGSVVILRLFIKY